MLYILHIVTVKHILTIVIFYAMENHNFLIVYPSYGEYLT